MRRGGSETLPASAGGDAGVPLTLRCVCGVFAGLLRRRYVARMKITPVLLVPAIEPLLPLWEAIGFTRTAEVPHGERLGFVILTKDDAELMLQTIDSVRADEPRVLEGPGQPGATSLFIEVDDLNAVVSKLPPGTDIFVERRTTPYGAIETFIRDTAGNVVIFAQFAR
jgi:hypothetical protein